VVKWENKLEIYGGDIVPIVRVEMWPGRTHAQKAELAKLINEAMISVAQVPPESTTIIFEDVPKENWAIGGILVSDANK